MDGLDSASEPTQAQIDLAKAQGYKWWGFYLPKVDGTDPLHGWSQAPVTALLRSGIVPVPICVPAPPHPADPVKLATASFNQALAYGLSPKVSILYNGSHIKASGPEWIPQPGPKPNVLPSQCAVQYGGTNIGGIECDLNVAANDFPITTGLVCDLEYNVSYDAQWYKTFQQTISFLSQPIKVKEDTMQALIVNGQLTVVGEALDNGDLMVFTQTPSGSWSVNDVTESIHNANPNDPRAYKVS